MVKQTKKRSLTTNDETWEVKSKNTPAIILVTLYFYIVVLLLILLDICNFASFKKE